MYFLLIIFVVVLLVLIVKNINLLQLWTTQRIDIFDLLKRRVKVFDIKRLHEKFISSDIQVGGQDRWIMGNWVLGVCVCVLMSGGGECESTASMCVLVCRCECTVRNSAAGWVFSARETYFFWRPRFEARRTNAKMREEIQEEASECLLKIQRGRTDVITRSEDLWQHRG